MSERDDPVAQGQGRLRRGHVGDQLLDVDGDIGRQA